MSYFIQISHSHPAQTDNRVWEKDDNRGLGDYSQRMRGDWRVRLLVRFRGFVEGYASTASVLLKVAGPTGKPT